MNYFLCELIRQTLACTTASKMAASVPPHHPTTLLVNTVCYSWQWESTLQVRIRKNMLWSMEDVHMNLLHG